MAFETFDSLGNFEEVFVIDSDHFLYLVELLFGIELFGNRTPIRHVPALRNGVVLLVQLLLDLHDFGPALAHFLIVFLLVSPYLCLNLCHKFFEPADLLKEDIEMLFALF